MTSKIVRRIRVYIRGGGYYDLKAGISAEKDCRLIIREGLVEKQTDGSTIYYPPHMIDYVRLDK